MYFVIKKATNGQYYFVIKANNHEIVATSELYHRKESANKTIKSIKRNLTADSEVVDSTV